MPATKRFVSKQNSTPILKQLKSKMSSHDDQNDSDNTNSEEEEDDVLNDILEENDLYKLICNSFIFFTLFLILYLNLIVLWLSYNRDECPYFIK